MQITFQTHSPKEIKGSFVYERTRKQVKTDAIDNLLIEVAKNVSGQISDEPSQITTFPGIGFSDFYAIGYHSKKTINLQIENSDDSSADPYIIQITFHFDTADSQFIDRRVNEVQSFNLQDKYFYKLDNLLTI